MAAKRWTIEHGGRRIGVEPLGGWRSGVRLFLDGELVGEAKGSRRVKVEAEGVEVRAWPAWHGDSITRAELVLSGAAPVPLDPPPGTLAARLEAFGRRHPALYSARHAIAGAGKVLFGLIGISLLLGLLPAISIDLPLPDIDLPSLPLPEIDLPRVTLPAWVEAILDSAKYWGPVLAGLILAAVEYRRRRRTSPERSREERPQGADEVDPAAPPEGSGRPRREEVGRGGPPEP